MPLKEDHIPGRTVPPPDPITIVQKGNESTPDIKEQYYIMERYVDSRWIINSKGEWEFQFKVKWDGYDILMWETRSRLNDNMAKTNQQYLRPGDDDFDMEEDFYERHPNAPHHDDPVGERINALGGQQTVHRRKGKAPIKGRQLF